MMLAVSSILFFGGRSRATCRTQSSAMIVCRASITVIEASTNTKAKKEIYSDSPRVTLCIIPMGVNPRSHVATAAHFQVSSAAQPPATTR
jgi:hypothetical protein